MKSDIRVPTISIGRMRKAILDELPTPCAIRDLDTRLVYANDLLAAVYGVKSSDELVGRVDSEINSWFVNNKAVLHEFDRQYKQVYRTQQSNATLEHHPHSVGYPFIFTKKPFFDREKRCVGLFGYNIRLDADCLNDFVRHHVHGSLLLNKPDDFFTEYECELLFYSLHNMKTNEAALKLGMEEKILEEALRALWRKAGVDHLDDLREFCEQRLYHRYLPQRLMGQRKTKQ